MVVFAPIGSDGSQTTNATQHNTSDGTAAQQFAELIKQPSSPGTGSPESAKNGTAAAKDLLKPNNPYFDNPLAEHDPGYDSETAKAQAFAATLYDYETSHSFCRRADIAQLLKTLGPAQAARFFAEAGSLQGPQVNARGVVFAKNQARLDQVLAKALLSPGVRLGDGSERGTLAFRLLQQGTRSGSGALSIAGILNQSGTNARVETLKNEFLSKIMVDGKALGNDTTDSAFFDRANYAQAALTLIDGDPKLQSLYLGPLGQQNGFPATYYQLQQYASFNPANASYQAGAKAAQHLGTDVFGKPSPVNFLRELNAHGNDPQWLAGFYQKLGPQTIKSLIDTLSSPVSATPGWSNAVAQTLGAAAPFLVPSFQQALGQTAATDMNGTFALNLDAILHLLDPGQKDGVPSQSYGLFTNVGIGYLSAAEAQTASQKSISYALAADSFGLAALDNPSGRALVTAYLVGEQQANPNFSSHFASQAVQGMVQTAANTFTARDQPLGVAIQGLSPLMIALNQPSAGSAANKIALQMFYGATNYLLGSPSDPNVSSAVAGTLPLIEEEGVIGSHRALVNGQPVQENLGLRTALMDVFYNNAPAILHQWEGSNETGGLGLNGQIQLGRFTAFELSPQGNSAVAKNNLDAMFGITKRFALYSVGKTSDPAITDLVGSKEPRKWAANIAGWILGSIANEGNLAAQDLNKSAQARASAQEFQDRVKYDWLGLVLDVVGLGSLGGVVGGGLGNVASTIALWTNNFKTGVGSLTSLPRDWTFIRSDTALGQGPSLDTLPAPAQEQITNALNQAGIQNVSVDSVLATLEGIYSHYNLPGYKEEIDNQFGIAGGTDLSYAMGPYMNALNSSVPQTNIVTLSQFLDGSWSG